MDKPLEIPGAPSREIKATLAGAGIREMMELAATLEDVIHLELGEPDFPTPSHVIDAVERALHTGRVRYTLPRGEPGLRDILAEKLRARNGIPTDSDRVVVTNGGTSAVFAALMAVVSLGDGVLIPDPGWPTFATATELVGGRLLRYRLTPESHFEPDLDELDSLAADARVLVLNSPSNPTGAVLSRRTVEHILEIADRHGLTILSDEVYERIVFDCETVSPAALHRSDRVISIFSFSKDYAMTGWRIGYLCAAPDVVERIVHIQEALLACPSWLGQRAAEAALLGPQDDISRMRAIYQQRRDLAVAALQQQGLLASRPAGAFYALAHVGPVDLDTFDLSRRLLLAEHVAVAPGQTFGLGGAGLVRLSLAASEDSIATGITRLARFLGEDAERPAQ